MKRQVRAPLITQPAGQTGDVRKLGRLVPGDPPQAAQGQRLATTRPVDPEAHDAFLRGLHHVSNLSQQEGAKAIEFFERAVRLDPTYAEPGAGGPDPRLRIGWVK